MTDHLPTNPPQAQAARQPHTFVVRVWWESDDGTTAGEWRGSIEHLASHQKRYFRDMRFPETFVTEILQATETPHY